MERRLFLKTMLSSVFFLQLFNLKSLFTKSDLPVKFSKTINPSEYSDKVVFIIPGQVVELPVNPRDGETYHFAPSMSWKAKKTYIKYKGAPIGGDREDLILDQDVKFSLSYSSKDKGWLFV